MPRTSHAGSNLASQAVTTKRAVHLYQLLKLLSAGNLTREALIRRLRRNLRAFYRDLNLLRACGIAVNLKDSKYSLGQNLDEAIALMPFPDPKLRVGEAMQMAKGNSSGNRKIKEKLDQIIR